MDILGMSAISLCLACTAPTTTTTTTTTTAKRAQLTARDHVASPRDLRMVSGHSMVNLCVFLSYQLSHSLSLSEFCTFNIFFLFFFFRWTYFFPVYLVFSMLSVDGEFSICRYISPLCVFVFCFFIRGSNLFCFIFSGKNFQLLNLYFFELLMLSKLNITIQRQLYNNCTHTHTKYYIEVVRDIYRSNATFVVVRIQNCSQGIEALWYWFSNIYTRCNLLECNYTALLRYLVFTAVRYFSTVVVPDFVGKSLSRGKTRNSIFSSFCKKINNSPVKRYLL